MTIALLRKEMRDLADPLQANILQKFFKTGPGEYGFGDKFYGIKVPVTRKIAKKYSDISYSDIKLLIQSKMHEERLLALIILVNRFIKKNIRKNEQKKIFNFYIKNKKFVNNWDLVDSSAPQIAGGWLSDKNKKILYDLGESENLWDRRISIMSCYYFIKKNEFSDALQISEILIKDKEDLIHKASGWMLREIGNRDRKKEQEFLDRHLRIMPRTMLRYAIEKFPEELRLKYLKA